MSTDKKREKKSNSGLWLFLRIQDNVVKQDRLVVASEELADCCEQILKRYNKFDAMVKSMLNIIIEEDDVVDFCHSNNITDPDGELGTSGEERSDGELGTSGEERSAGEERVILHYYLDVVNETITSRKAFFQKHGVALLNYMPCGYSYGSEQGYIGWDYVYIPGGKIE